MATRNFKPVYSLVALLVCSTMGATRANELQGELRYLSENHPLLKASQFALDAAEQRRKASYSGYFPKITVTADKGNEEITTTSTTDYDRERFGISIEQNLYNGGKTKAGVNVAEIDRRIKDLERKSVSQDIALEALIAYLQVLRNRLLIGLAETNEVITTTQLEMEQKRVQRGSGIAVDEMQASTRLQIVRERKVFYEQGMRDALAAYEQVFGHEPDLTTIQDLDNFTAALPAELEQAIQKGLNGNPRLLLTQLQAERADKTIAVERSAWFPTVDLVASQNREEKVGGIPSKDEDSVVLKFSWNFMTGLETYRRSKAASFDFYESQEREKNIARRTTESIRLSWNQYQKGLERLQLLEDAASSSRQVMEGRKKLRDAGKETVLAVLDAEVEYFGVLANMVNAMVDARLGSYRLLHSVGALDIQGFGLEGGDFKLPVKPVKDVIDQLIGQGNFSPPPPQEPVRLTEPTAPAAPSADERRAQAMVDAASNSSSTASNAQTQGLLNFQNPEASVIAEPTIKVEPLAQQEAQTATPNIEVESTFQQDSQVVQPETKVEALAQQATETVEPAEAITVEPPLTAQETVAQEQPVEPMASVGSEVVEQPVEPTASINPEVVEQPAELNQASVQAPEQASERPEVPDQRESIATTVLSWATAWSNRAFDEYAGFYSNSFLTKDFKGRQNWLEYRKPRIVYKPSISVEVVDIQVNPLNDRQVEVEFTQFYEGGQLNVRSRKKLLLGLEHNGWKILWEGNASDTMLGVESGTEKKQETPSDRPVQLPPVSDSLVPPLEVTEQEPQSISAVDPRETGDLSVQEEAVSEDPVVEDVVTREAEPILSIDKESIAKFLEDWANRWSSKDFEAYANLYGEEFSNPKFSRLEDWLAYRKPRILGKNSIEVSVELLEVKPLDDGRVETRVIQNYAGNQLKVRSLKRLILDVSGETPKIIWEGNA